MLINNINNNYSKKEKRKKKKRRKKIIMLKAYKIKLVEKELLVKMKPIKIHLNNNNNL